MGNWFFDEETRKKKTLKKDCIYNNDSRQLEVNVWKDLRGSLLVTLYKVPLQKAQIHQYTTSYTEHYRRENSENLDLIGPKIALLNKM